MKKSLKTPFIAIIVFLAIFFIVGFIIRNGLVTTTEMKSESRTVCDGKIIRGDDEIPRGASCYVVEAEIGSTPAGLTLSIIWIQSIILVALSLFWLLFRLIRNLFIKTKSTSN